ncbi:MoaD/ThiS family protein [Chloroflexota bacterium]
MSSVTVNIPPHLQFLAKGTEELNVDGNTVGDCLSLLVTEFPDLKEHIFSKENNMFEDIMIMINGESAYPNTEAQPVKDGDEMDIIHVIGGG